MCAPPEPDGWLGCAGGCTVCTALISSFDLYRQHHPRCLPAPTSCAGAYRACSADCPAPSLDDASCRDEPGGWPGCVGSGCTVDRALVAANPGYLRANPLCGVADLGTASHVGCSPLCPPVIQDGAPDGWDGCRGYGVWVCVELLDGFPRYFENHPACSPNTTCQGLHFACSSSCPPPGPGDR
jgi:hypothetical protein